MNKVILLGNLTRDVDLNFTASGKAVGKVGIAVNEKWKDQAGNRKESVHFFETISWGITAENIQKYFSKGNQILIEGKLQQESWDDKQTGQKRSRVIVQIESFFFPHSKRDDSDHSSYQKSHSAPSTTPPAAQVSPAPNHMNDALDMQDDEDVIPF